MFKSQTRTGESVRKHCRLIKEARIRLAQEKSQYQREQMESLKERLSDYKIMMQKVPEEYLTKGIKENLVKSKEVQIFRTVQAKVVDKTNQHWRLNDLLQMVKDDKIA